MNFQVKCFSHAFVCARACVCVFTNFLILLTHTIFHCEHFDVHLEELAHLKTHAINFNQKNSMHHTQMNIACDLARFIINAMNKMH